MKRQRVLNVTTGIYMDFFAAKQAVEDWCACEWIDDVSIRSLTSEQARQARMQREVDQELFPRAELSGMHFMRPKGSNYRAPREAYDATELPLVGHTCGWRQKLLRQLAVSA